MTSVSSAAQKHDSHLTFSDVEETQILEDLTLGSSGALVLQPLQGVHSDTQVLEFVCAAVEDALFFAQGLFTPERVQMLASL